MIWVGGVHGVGKTSALGLTTLKDPSLKYLYLGRKFYETAEKMGYSWSELADQQKLLNVENYVKKELDTQLLRNNLLVDCHFAIHFNEAITLPGFHKKNLERFALQEELKRGVINLFAQPEIISKRRKESGKIIRSYLTEEDKKTIYKELADSSTYFDYFVESLGPKVTSERIDTSFLSLEEVTNKILKFYHEL